ncbi:MAG: hypothetical protein ACXW4T_05420 [Candidatus Limnocylindrales bacterium]
MSRILSLAMAALLLAACIPGVSPPPNGEPSDAPATLPPVASDGPGKASPTLEIPPPP